MEQRRDHRACRRAARGRVAALDSTKHDETSKENRTQHRNRRGMHRNRSMTRSIERYSTNCRGKSVIILVCVSVVASARSSFVSLIRSFCRRTSQPSQIPAEALADGCLGCPPPTMRLLLCGILVYQDLKTRILPDQRRRQGSTPEIVCLPAH